MRFVLGQKYVSNKEASLFAEVAQLDDDGHAAWVQLRNSDGEPLKEGERVVYAQFIRYWSLVP